jgi:cell division transport system permease protein
MKSHRLFNMYFITTISVALVLFLVGLECLVVLSAHELMRHVKENVVVSVVMTDECSADQRGRLERILDASPYCLDYHYISREQALQEHIENLGEDPQHFLGYNPLFDSYEVHLHAPYAQSDSIAQIEEGLLSLPYISKVVYQRDVLEVLDKNLNDVGVILSLVAIALLVIALVLIGNTIQLQVYSKRFIINTMRLVGATPWVIKWPLIRRNILMGFEAGLLAIALLAGAYYYCLARLGVMLFPLTWVNICFVVLSVLIFGMLITFFASLAATNRYIRMKISKMYEI